MSLRNLDTLFFRQIGRFLLVGGLATLLDVAAFGVLHWFMPAYPTLCFVLAFFLSVCSRFIADRHFTFQNTRTAYGRQFVLYLLTCLLTMGIGLATFHLFLWFGIVEIGSKVLSVPFVTVSGFLFFRHIVFSR